MSGYNRYYTNFSSEEPATPQEIAQAHALAQQMQEGTFFTPQQEAQVNRMYRRNNPLSFLGDKVEHFLGLRQLGQQLVQGADPRTRAGFFGDLSMFVPGPKGDASPMMGELGMPGQFRDYGGANVHPLERGITHEGPNPGARGASIRGLIRRAEGVNPLRRNDPMAVAKAKHDILEKQMAQNIERHRAMQAVKMRRQVDQHLGSAPMAGQAHDPTQETDLGMHGGQAQHFFRRQGGNDPQLVAHRQAALHRLYMMRMHNHLN